MTKAERPSDTEMLDWLEEKGHPYWYLEVQPDAIYLEDNVALNYGVPTLRDAIAAAMRGERNDH